MPDAGTLFVIAWTMLGFGGALIALAAIVLVLAAVRWLLS